MKRTSLAIRYKINRLRAITAHISPYLNGLAPETYDFVAALNAEAARLRTGVRSRARRGVLVDANRATCRRASATGTRSLGSFGGGRQWRLGRDPGRARGRSVGRRAADDRCDHHPCASLRSRWKRGAERNALGRSRGGFSTKINARTNAEGLPIGVVITPGQAHDVTAFPA